MKRYLAAALLACTLNVFGQDGILRLPVNEGFETQTSKQLPDGPLPNSWSQLYVGNNKPQSLNWKITSGGGSPAGNENIHKPDTTHSGKYNATLWLTTLNSHSMYLISPLIDFRGTSKPTLTFWYSQYSDRASSTDLSEIDNYEITVGYFINNVWFPIRDYTMPTDDTEPWRMSDSILLPEEVIGRNDVQIAFLGKTKVLGHGCCIDDIKIEERDVIAKYVDESCFTPSQTSDIIPTNTADNVILQLRVEAHGNSGVLNLNSLTATALNDAANIGDENPISSVKLYYTETDIFKANNLLSTTSIVNGKATFSNIGFDLQPGYNYLWITCDIKEDVSHDFRNDTIDMKIEPGAINIGGRTFPASTLDPAGKRLINESIFFDDFENESLFNINWPTKTGDFEIDHPVDNSNYGKTPLTVGYADPSYAHSGQWMMGTNIGTENDGTFSHEHSSYVISKPIDCSNYKDVNLIFYRYLNLGGNDIATISVSIDGGEWEDVWESSSVIANKNWGYQYISLKKLADHKNNVRIRFGLVPGSSDLNYSGWNIDDVAIVGTFVKYDAIITDIFSPKSSCDLTNNETINIRIKNAGFSDIESSRTFKAGFSVDGGVTWVDEPISGGLARGANTPFTFNAKANLSELGQHNFNVRVTLTDNKGRNIDDKPDNNEVQKKIMSLPYISMPYNENFNTDGYWYSNNDTWQNMKPGYATSRCWATKIIRGFYDRYLPNNSDTLESPCFNMSNVQKPILEFKLKCDVADTDGLAVYYSTDGGAHWSLLSEYDYEGQFGYKHPCWNWYNTTDDNIDALGTNGWSGYFDWTTVMLLMPDDVGGKTSVKLRFVFSACVENEENNGDYEGIAIDDIRIYESPIDAGVVAIKPESDCHLLKEQPITITIQNFGNRAITSADDLTASVTINNKTTLTQTFHLDGNETIAVNGTKDFTFDQTYDMWYKKEYTMTATTLIDGDTLLFSNSSNDALPTPAVATVQGEPQYDLGADIGTINPLAFDPKPNGGVKSNGDNFNNYKWYWYDYGAPKTDDHKHESTGKSLTAARAFNDANDELEYYCYIDATVIVSDSKTCTETDSIKIINSHYDVGVINNGIVAKTNSGYTFTPLPDGFCSNTPFDSIGVEVKNFSNQVETNENFTISICYQMPNSDGDIITYAEDTTISENPFVADGTFVYIFKRQPQFEFSGEQNIKFFTKIKADLNYTNDAQTKDINVWQLPKADLGADSVLTADPTTIPGTLVTDNISGANYYWNNSNVSSGNSFTITRQTTAEYKVDVVDELHGCPSATDNILIISDNWKITELLSPVISNCDPLNDVDITIRIENNSQNTYSAGYKIPATITFNGNTFNEVIAITASMAEDLATNSEFIYTFNTKIDMPQIGAYDLNVEINPKHDINRNDNILNQEIDIWGTPRLDIGPDTIYTLQPDTIMLSTGTEFTKKRWFDNGTEFKNLEYFTPTSNICWVYASNEHGCYADDQKIKIANNYYASDTVRIVKTDIGIDRMESPITACDIESFNSIKLRLTNNGLDNVESNITLPIMVKINNNAPIRKEYVLQTELNPETTTTATIPFDFNFDKNETYSVKAWLDWNMDRFNENDTISTVVSQYPSPDPFTLGDDIYTTCPDTLVLHAPENYYNYSWRGGQSNTNTLAISYIGTRTYALKVSNQYGCSYSDSLVVSLTKPEIDITGLGFSTDICESESLSKVSFNLKNNGEDIIAKGSQIDIEYSINGGTPVNETYKVGHTLNSGESVAIIFKQQADLRNAANYALNITARIADTVAVSSKDYTVTVHESPKISLGKDIATFEQSITLNAGSGYSSYLWNTGATTDKIEVSTNGEYWVTAVNNYGCKNSDTIKVRLIPATIAIFELKSPKSACSIEKEPITINIVNNGNEKIEKGNSYEISCIVDNDSTVSITGILSVDFATKSRFDISMNDLLTTNRAGKHTLAFTISIEGAVVDQSEFEYEIYGTPEFELKDVANISFPYSLAPTTSLADATYEWNTGAKTKAIEVTENGTYTLKITDSHGCSAEKSVTIKTTGINNSSVANIAVYPNPVKDILNIDFGGRMTNSCQILIANATGRIIFASKQTSDIMPIAVDDWTQGIYFIKITSNSESRIIKIVKE